MAGEIEAKLKAERMFAEARAKALGGPYANISKEYVNKYMDSSSLSKALADRVSSDYSLGYLSGWAGIPGDMLNALTSWAVSGIPDQRLRQQAKQSLTVAGTEDIGEAMGADVESSAFQWGTVGLPGLEDLVKKSPYLSMIMLGGKSKNTKKALSREDFYKKFDMHTDIRGRDSGTAEQNFESIMQGGFRQGAYNRLPAGLSEKRSGRPAQFAPKEGDMVYLIPQSVEGKSGGGRPMIPKGWKPGGDDGGLVVQIMEGEDLYDAYVRTVKGE